MERSALAGHLSVLALIATVLTTDAAQAQPPPGPRIVVTRSDAEARDLARSVAESVVGRFLLLGIEARVPEPAAEEASEEDELRRAEQAYNNLHPREAQAAVDGVMLRAHQTGGRGLTREHLQHALMLSAMVGQALRDEQRIENAITQLLSMAPAFEPAEELYPPTIRRRIQNRRAEGLTAAQERGQVTWPGLPEGATVFVDGAPHPGPHHAMVVSPGVHLVRAEAGGYHGAGTAIEVQPGGRAEVELTLSIDGHAALRESFPPGGPPPEPWLAAASREGASLVLIDVHGGVVHARDLASGRSVRLPPERHRTATAIADSVLRGLSPAIVVPPEDGTPLLPWIVAGSVVAVTATVVTIVLLTADESQGGVVLGWRRLD